MPFRLIAPNASRRSPFWRVRGTEFGEYVDRSTGASERREAAKTLALWREEAKRRSVVGSKKTGPTFASAAFAYMQAGGEKRFVKPLLNRLKETPLSEIDQSLIDMIASEIYPGATAATRNRQVYSPVSAILRRAGVVLALRRPKGAQGERRTDYLSTDDAFKLIDASAALNPRFGALLTFLLYTGVRLSEALRLRPEDVDMRRATALIRQTKNGKPVTVHLPEPVLAALRGLSGAGSVFRLTKSGRLYNLLAEAEKAAGLALPSRAAFHIFRHTHATWRRLHTGADTSALVNTGLWASRSAASIYEHLDASAESRKSDLLPVKQAREN